MGLVLKTELCVMHSLFYDIDQSYPKELEKGRALRTKQGQRLKRNGNTKPIRLGVKHDQRKQEEQIRRIIVHTGT